jgi:putative RecB family exonuclease
MHIISSILPKKPESKELFSLSVSKVKTFEDCKAKYKYSYIEKLPKKDWEHLSYGSYLHEILETFHKSLLELSEQDLTIAMTEAFKQASESFKDKITTEQKKEAFETVNSYLNKLFKNPPKSKMIGVEKQFYVDIGGKILLNGFIDRVELDEDGIIHVSDYKTTKNKKYLKDYFQLLTYAFVLMLEDPSINKVRASYILLRHDFEYLTKEFTREDTKVIADKFIQKLDDINEEKIFRPNPTPLCGYCDFMEHCSAGQAFLKKRGMLKTSNEKKSDYGLKGW